MDNRSIYATYGRLGGPSSASVATPTTSINAGQYRSPSRILLESGYLTLPGHTRHHGHNHHHHGHGKDHVYENLYSSPNNNTSTTNNTTTTDVPDSSVLSPSNKEKYMSNLRSSVQLKRSLPCANCSKPESPSITTTSSSLDRKLYKSKSKDRKDKCPVCSDGNNGKMSSNASGKSSQLKSSSQLNQQVIWIKQDDPTDVNGRSGKIGEKKNTENTRDASSSSTATGKIGGKSCSSSRKKRKNWWQKDWFLEVDPQRRFQFIQSTLIICNVFALLCGVIGLIVAGFVDPRPSVTSFGGQLTIVSVYIILTSLTGLYGARRESVSLLVLYGCMIVASLFFRSIFYFVVTFFTSSATSIALSMIAAFLEIILILFAFALASEVRLKKLDRKRKQNDPSKGESGSVKHKETSSSNHHSSANNSTGNKDKSNNTDRDLESASPVASAETDSTTSNVDSSGLFANGELNSSGRFISSGSPLFASLSRSPNSLLFNLTSKNSPTSTSVTMTTSSTGRPFTRLTASPSSSPSIATSSASKLANVGNKSNSIITSLTFTSPGAVTSRTTTTTTTAAAATVTTSTLASKSASASASATPGRGMLALAQISPSSATRVKGDSQIVKNFSPTTPVLASASVASTLTSVTSTRPGSGQVNSLLTSYSMSISRSMNNSSTSSFKGSGGIRPAAYF